MKKRIFLMTIAISAMSFVTSCDKAAKKEAPAVEAEEVVEAVEVGPNTLSAAEKADGWVLLFDAQLLKAGEAIKKIIFLLLGR